MITYFNYMMISLFILQRQYLHVAFVTFDSINVINGDAYQKSYVYIVLLIAIALFFFIVMLISTSFCISTTDPSGVENISAMVITIGFLIVDSICLFYLTLQFYKRVHSRHSAKWGDMFYNKKILLVLFYVIAKKLIC
jgi:hypothetical protein